MQEQFENHENVDRLVVDDRVIHLVGTAHISRTSVELAEEVIREVKPDSVAVELCESRYNSLKDPDRWKNTDIVSIIRQGKAYVLLAQLILAGFQKKLGKHLKVKPGEEMLKAANVADDIGAEIVFADREIRTTLKRTWRALSFFSMCKVMGAMVFGLFSTEQIEEEEIERLKSADALEELMRDFSEALPEVRVALIDERDQYLASKIKEAPGKNIVAIVGAGHVPGIKKCIEGEIDRTELEALPPGRITAKLIAWGIPAVIIGLIAYGFISSGATKSLEMIEAWFWINATLGALGSALAFAHPLTILSAFIASPFTSVNPFVAAGWVAGIVEATVRKPRVADLENIADDISTFKGLLSNRVSKILLVICLTNLLGTIGTIYGAKVLVTLVGQ